MIKLALITYSYIAPPMVTITDSPVDGEVTTGKPIMLTCTATGVSLPSIIWRKGNGDTLNDPNRVFVSDIHTLLSSSQRVYLIKKNFYFTRFYTLFRLILSNKEKY